MRGPIDYIVVGFEGNNFDGSILRELGAAIDKGIISLVALLLVVKDNEGTVSTVDITSTSDEYLLEFTQRYPVSGDLIDKDDVDEVAELLENNTSAGLLAVEHVWAKPLKQAIINAGGVLVADGRIHPDAAAQLDD